MTAQIELHCWIDEHVDAGVQHGWVAELHHGGLLLPGSSSPLPQLPQAYTADLEASSILWGQVSACSLAFLMVPERGTSTRYATALVLEVQASACFSWDSKPALLFFSAARTRSWQL